MYFTGSVGMISAAVRAVSIPSSLLIASCYICPAAGSPHRSDVDEASKASTPHFPVSRFHHTSMRLD
jgi:hypothetical protein